MRAGPGIFLQVGYARNDDDGWGPDHVPGSELSTQSTTRQPDTLVAGNNAAVSSYSTSSSVANPTSGASSCLVLDEQPDIHTLVTTNTVPKGEDPVALAPEANQPECRATNRGSVVGTEAEEALVNAVRSEKVTSYRPTGSETGASLRAEGEKPPETVPGVCRMKGTVTLK